MKLRAMCVSVHYADLLAKGIERWAAGCDELTVVTAERDADTLDVCRRHGVATYTTDLFWANGASFNKGAAMSAAALALGWHGRRDDEWLLCFDADIVPPVDWRGQVEREPLSPGRLYGCRRYELPEDASELDVPPHATPMPQGWVIGFFMLFHAADANVTRPLFDCDFPHAGNYDTTFARRWPMQRHVMLPLRVAHLGRERENWCGRHNRPALAELLKRRAHGEDWEGERMAAKPEIR